MRGNKEQSVFYFTAILLYTFQVLLHPSSGVQETVFLMMGVRAPETCGVLLQ
jgi:hypothetical protein